MPAVITARYDDDRKSMMMRQQRLWAAEDQLNPELSDTDLFFLLGIMEHAIRKAVHHTFLSLIQETATIYNCASDYNCIQSHIATVAARYTQMCESTDIVNQTMCKLLLYAREQ
jgi:hypothetical protein